MAPPVSGYKWMHDPERFKAFFTELDILLDRPSNGVSKTSKFKSFCAGYDRTRNYILTYGANPRMVYSLVKIGPGPHYEKHPDWWLEGARMAIEEGHKNWLKQEHPYGPYR